MEGMVLAGQVGVSTNIFVSSGFVLLLVGIIIGVLITLKMRG